MQSGEMKYGQLGTTMAFGFRLAFACPAFLGAAMIGPHKSCCKPIGILIF